MSVLEKIASDTMRLNRIHVYDIDYVLNSQNTPHILSLWLSYGVSSILEKIAGDIMIMRLQFLLNGDLYKAITLCRLIIFPLKKDIKQLCINS